MRKAGIDDKGLATKPYDEVMRQTSLDETKLLPIEETVEDDGRERVDSTISVALLVQESEMKS